MGLLSLARLPFRLIRGPARVTADISKPVTRPVTSWIKQLLASLGGEPARRRRRARRLAASLSAELHRLGFSRRVAKGGKKKRVVVQRVRFEEPLLLTRDELWCPVDLARLPTGVKTNELRDEDVLTSINDRLDSAVRVDTLANGKLCFVIRMSGQTFPEIFAINNFKLPSDAPPLAIPLGIDGEGQTQWADLARLPHLLLVGPTGKGKSVFVHAMLTTWISRNTAQDIEIWLADHKGGVELNRYKSLMGSRGRPGIVRRFSYKPDETVELLQAALKELERRNELLRQADCSDIADYARNTGQYLRPLAIVIDEIFFLMLNKEKIDPEVGKAKGGMTISQWSEHLFAKIASAGRAAGVHLVIATQRTGKDVLTPLITANFETRAVFGMADMYQSIYVIGSADAVGLPKGRIIWRAEGGELQEVQAPLIKPDQTRLLIDRISRYGPDGGLGKADEAKRFCEDAKLLLAVACENFEGKFAVHALFQHERVRGVIRQERVEEIARRLQKDGVLLSGGPRKARQVAQAFFGRPQLLDAMYGPEAAAQMTPDEAPAGDTGPATTPDPTPTLPATAADEEPPADPHPEVIDGELDPDRPPPGPFRELFGFDVIDGDAVDPDAPSDE